ncbi:MAG: glycosyl hydrolase family 18 protein, partial [Gemmatimonadota bacterium]
RCPPSVAVAATLSAALLSLSAVTATAQERVERLFYYVDREAAWKSLFEHIGEISIVAPAAYSVDASGVVWGAVDPRVLALAEEHGVGVVPLIVNPGFDQEELHALLQDDAARRRTIESLVGECRRHGYHGIQFDFENLAHEDRDAYTRFYREAAEALHGAGCEISVAVVHRPEEFPGPTRYHGWMFADWRGGYDLAALAEAGDFISVMTYSQHTRRTPPGPQAGLPWVREVAEYFLQFVPPGKLSLGIPLGSQHWYTSYEEQIDPELARSYSEQVSYEWGLGLAERHGATPVWSDEQQVAYAFYPVGGTFEWIFFEDARSFRAKLGLVDELGLRGFSAWVLGPEDPALWDVLAERRGAAARR